MRTYCKLFASLLESSVWDLPHATRICFVTMLVKKDKDGVVNASLPGLAHMARITIAEAQSAIDTLSSPDPYSRDKANDGRRIEAVENGWRILNADKFRDLESTIDRRAKTRERVAKYRSKSAGTLAERVTIQRESETE